MNYTIHQLAKMAGVTVRTLHHYDAMGLLKPSRNKSNGYRLYDNNDVLTLQQILFFRELEFSLEHIKEMLDAPHFNQSDALMDQKKLLELKKKRIEGLITSIENTLTNLKGGGIMNNDDLFASFDDKELVENMEEAKRRWGNTDAYKQSIERTKHWTKQDYERIKEEGNKFTQQLANAIDKEITSPEIQALIEKHHQGIEYFYDCPLDMYRGLAQMYVDDPRFTKYYDKFRPGLAQFVHDAIVYYCDQRKAK
jgi:DNA-binding transcriptional MerR regulator